MESGLSAMRPDHGQLPRFPAQQIYSRGAVNRVVATELGETLPALFAVAAIIRRRVHVSF